MNNSNHKEPGITRFVIAGHGLEAWFTANHLLAAFGGRRIEIKVCPVPGSEKLDDLYSVWPIGMDDGLDPIRLSIKALFQECRGSFSLGTQYEELFRPYGTIGLDFMGTPFHHHWLRASAEKSTASYFDWSPASVAMKNERFAPPVAQNAIGSLQHGMALHVDTTLLTQMLRDRALRNGAIESTGSLSCIDRENDDGRIKGLETDKGESLTAELYLDCSGPRKSLIAGSRTAIWQPAPGVDRYRISTGKEKSQEPPPSFHQVATNANGWQINIPGNGWKVQLKLASSTGSTEGETVSPGFFQKPWAENCIALGMASCSLLPVEPVHARYLATSIKRMIDLMPGVNCDPQETVEYNNLAETDLVEILDLVAAHEYFRKLNMGKPQTEMHDSLQKRVDLYTQRGWIAPPDSNFFKPSDWVASFMQLGLVPSRPDRLAGRLPPDTLEGHLKNLMARIKKTAMEFPPLQQFRTP